MFGWNFSYFSLYLLPLLLSLGITTSLCEYSFHPPIWYLYTLIRPTLSCLQADLFYFCPGMTDVSRPKSSSLDKLPLLCPCCSFTRRSRAGPSPPDASLLLPGRQADLPSLPAVLRVHWCPCVQGPVADLFFKFGKSGFHHLSGQPTGLHLYLVPFQLPVPM